MSNKISNPLKAQLAYIDKPAFTPTFEMNLLRNQIMIDLHLNPNDTATILAVKSAIGGLSLPLEPFTSSRSKDLTCLWLSNGRWLLVGAKDKNSDLLSRLKKSLRYVSLSYFCDVSGQRSIFRLNGPSVLTTIYKAGFFDVSHSSFGAGFVKRFSFKAVSSLVHIISLDKSRQVIDVYVMRSYSEYLYNWLCQTGHASSDISL